MPTARKSRPALLTRGPIVVPLDGSKPSERALDYALLLARIWGELIILVGVATSRNQGGLAGLMPPVALEFEQRGAEQAEAYLRKIRGRVRRSTKAEAMVRVGDPASEVLRAGRSVKARVLVLSTHGRSGVSRMVQGSVAARLIRKSPIPVLAVGPQLLQTKGKPRLKHIMVPLDGTKESEAALPVAKALAKEAGARVSLIRVMPWGVEFAYPAQTPLYDKSIDKALQDAAATYLDQRRAALGEDVECFVRRGASAPRLRNFVARHNVDLVVMSTHGRGGVARATLGSVADRMLQGKAPVLLIKPT